MMMMTARCVRVCGGKPSKLSFSEWEAAAIGKQTPTRRPTIQTYTNTHTNQGWGIISSRFGLFSYGRNSIECFYRRWMSHWPMRRSLVQTIRPTDRSTNPTRSVPFCSVRPARYKRVHLDSLHSANVATSPAFVPFASCYSPYSLSYHNTNTFVTTFGVLSSCVLRPDPTITFERGCDTPIAV